LSPRVYHSLATPPTLLGIEKVAAVVFLALHALIFAIFTIASNHGSFVLGLFLLNLILLGFHGWLAVKNQADPYYLETFLRSLLLPTAFAARPSWDAPRGGLFSLLK